MPTEHNRHEEQYMLRSSRESARHVESLEDGSSDSQAAGSNDPHTSSRVISTPSPSQVIYRLLPAKFRWILNSIVKWSQGPIPPRPFRIKSLAPKIQSIPKRLADSLTRYILIHWLIVWSLICGILFIFILARSETSCQIHSYGSPLRLSCVSRLWRGSTECGLNGLECRPFQNNTFAFRCPATCETVRVLEPYIIGNTIINYQSLIVGGGGNATYPQIYRGDSFICPAAIHAGLFPARIGGSGIINLLGEYSNFTGTISNGLQGLDFHSTFPQSYAFDEINGTSSGCSDPRWIIMALTIVYTTIVSLCTMSASRFFSAVFISAYFCIALAADAPQSSSFYVVVSLAFRGFLPAAFIGFVIYRFVSKHTLDNLEAPLDKTILWLGPFWVGALDNMTFDLLPLQRLTPHDFMEPGAISVLVVVILVIAAAAIGQVWAYRIEGRLLTYLKFYLALGIVIVGLVFIPKLNLRLHHYIIALLLLPGTALQTRPSLVYQGLLVGLFINGIARWGFDSVLQTSGDLFATDLGSMLPQFQLPEITSSNITFTWPVLAAGYSGISVLVNDVERYRAFEDHISSNFTWTREREGEDVYFRFGFVKYGRIQDSSVGRYSDPGTWLANSSWILIDPEGR